MKRAFYVTKESLYYKDYKEYMDNVRTQRLFVDKFLEENKIESKKYVVYGDGLCNCSFTEEDKPNIRLDIIPTNNDKCKFFQHLNKPDSRGLCAFRKNSDILKKFSQYCIDNNIIINTIEPDLRDYLETLYLGGYTRHIFPCNDGIYLIVTSDSIQKNDNPKGFISLSLSEFIQNLRNEIINNNIIKEI